MRKLLTLATPTLVAVAVSTVLSAGGGAYAAHLITSGDIKDGAVHSPDIKDGGVHSRDIANHGVKQVDLDKSIIKKLNAKTKAGPKGAKGATGKTGPQGKQGVPGKPGAPGANGADGLSGYTVILHYTRNDGSDLGAAVPAGATNHPLTATCPEGLYAISGGFSNGNTNPGNDLVVRESVPAGFTRIDSTHGTATGWEVTVDNPTGTAQHAEVALVCASISTDNPQD